jgi:hypothetical protein
MSAIALPVADAATTVGACPGNLYWSAKDAAPGQSVIAGVLAGFVFLGVITEPFSSWSWRVGHGLVVARRVALRHGEAPDR